MSYIPEKTIYLCLAHMSEDGIEQKYVKEAFDTNWVVPLGPNEMLLRKTSRTLSGERMKLSHFRRERQRCILH